MLQKNKEELKTEKQIEQDEQELKTIEKGDDRDDFMETMQPLDEDCWQYRLVGVNVHQGRANAGHYWSYINTNRSGDKIDSNQDITSNWMEYNDT